MKTAPSETSIVVLTYNRRAELLRNLARIVRGSPGVPVLVVDNHSTDGTAAALARLFPAVRVIQAPRNLGAAARNLGVQACATAYVAFCDDDTYWEANALKRAEELLNRHREVAVLSGRVLVGPAGRPDPCCVDMAHSPLGDVAGLPLLIGFMAGACVMRVQAFIDAGGYEPRFFLGAEETLLCLDLLSSGWRIAYAPDVVTHHFPSRARNASQRAAMLVRNAIWVAWMRLPADYAWRETAHQLRQAAREAHLLRTGLATLRGLPWALGQRRVVPAQVASMWRRVHCRNGVH